MTDVGAGPADEQRQAGLDPGTWRLAVVAGVRMDMPGEYPEVLVHEAVAPWRELAIPVGMAEGNAIAYAWRGLTTPRPLTHALFADVLERHGVQLEAVRITARRGRSFYAELDTTGPQGRQVISCRPSDALALVLRQRLPTPVLVAEWVFGPEDDFHASSVVTAPASPVPAPTAGDENEAPTSGDAADAVPVVDAPAPASDTPVADVPVADAPASEVPVTDEQVADVPVTDVPAG